MWWKTKETHTATELAEMSKLTKKFAWIPTRLTDGVYVWLQDYCICWFFSSRYEWEAGTYDIFDNMRTYSFGEEFLRQYNNREVYRFPKLMNTIKAIKLMFKTIKFK